jgi:methionyl-tRNA formyltransferase
LGEYAWSNNYRTLPFFWVNSAKKYIFVVSQAKIAKSMDELPDADRLLNKSNINSKFEGIIQDGTKDSYFGKLKPAQCEIKIDKGIQCAYNLIRGVSKLYYGVFVQIDTSQIIIIWRQKLSATSRRRQ